MNKRVYPWVLVGLLSFNFGVVYFDRQALNFLMPLIQPELHLSNQQVGMLGSALGFSWALAGLVVGRVSDLLGRRKVILVIAAFIFSGASALAGWATSFSMLLVTRLLMGLAEGGVMPISQALISAEVDPARRGLAMGVAQNFGANLLSNFLGPIAVVAVGTAFGWRNAFYLAGLPGVLAAFLMLWLIREPPREQLAASAAAGGAVGGAGTAPRHHLNVTDRVFATAQRAVHPSTALARVRDVRDRGCGQRGLSPGHGNHPVGDRAAASTCDGAGAHDGIGRNHWRGVRSDARRVGC